MELIFIDIIKFSSPDKKSDYFRYVGKSELVELYKRYFQGEKLTQLQAEYNLPPVSPGQFISLASMCSTGGSMISVKLLMTGTLLKYEQSLIPKLIKIFLHHKAYPEKLFLIISNTRFSIIVISALQLTPPEIAAFKKDLLCP